MSTIIRSLELNVPRLRPNALPWGSAEVQLTAVICSSATSCTAINLDLPSVLEDLSAVLEPEGYADDDATEQHRSQSLGVEILGCDHGISFSLGTAMLDIPAAYQAGRPKTSSAPENFRVSLTDRTGARVGTLSGAFVTRQRAIALPTAAKNVGDVSTPLDDSLRGEEKNTDPQPDHASEENTKSNANCGGTNEEVSDGGVDASQSFEVGKQTVHLSEHVKYM